MQTTINEIYQTSIRPLGEAERLELARLILSDLTDAKLNVNPALSTRKATLWRDWTANKAIAASSFVDDSREAIYDGE